MKRFIFFLVGGIVLTSCENEQKAKVADYKIDMPKNNDNRLIQKYSSKMQALFQSDEGIIRGITLKTYSEKVKSFIEAGDSIATFTTVNEEKNHLLNCKIVFNIYEDADISFITEPVNHTIKEIRIATYLNSQVASDSLKTEMTAYFTEKYGNTSLKERKKVKWVNDSLKIDLEDVGVPEAPGLQVRFTRP